MFALPGAANGPGSGIHTPAPALPLFRRRRDFRIRTGRDRDRHRRTCAQRAIARESTTRHRCSRQYIGDLRRPALARSYGNSGAVALRLLDAGSGPRPGESAGAADTHRARCGVGVVVRNRRVDAMSVRLRGHNDVHHPINCGALRVTERRHILRCADKTSQHSPDAGRSSSHSGPPPRLPQASRPRPPRSIARDATTSRSKRPSRPPGPRALCSRRRSLRRAGDARGGKYSHPTRGSLSPLGPSLPQPNDTKPAGDLAGDRSQGASPQDR
jgi:hypothetical protein